MKTQIALILALSRGLSGADAQRLQIGAPGSSLTTTVSFTNSTVDSASKKVAWIFQASDSAAVTQLLFRYGVRTGTPVAHRVSLQGVATSNATGNPDGTVLAAGAITPPADTSQDGKIQAVPITNDGAGNPIGSYTLTRGNYYALVVEPCSGPVAPCSAAASPDASNNSSFTTVMLGGLFGSGRGGVPYAKSYNGSAWTAATGDMPLFGYRSATSSYGYPVQSVTLAQISSGAESAMAFNIPDTLASTYKIVGIRWSGSGPAGNKSTKILLYAGNSVLQSLTWDSDVDRSYGTGGTASNFEAFFSDPLPALNTGVTYRIGFSPQDSSNNVSLATVDLAAPGDRTAFSGGTMFWLSSRSSCGAPCDSTAAAWSDSTSSRPVMNLILEDLTPPSGGRSSTAVTYVQ